MKDAESSDEPSAGFTLIELMVVVLILGVLMAIVVPTLLATTRSAEKSAATSNLTNTLLDAKAYYDSHSQSFGSTTTLESALSSTEPNLTFTSSAAVGDTPNDVSVATYNGNAEVVLAAQAPTSTTCYFLDDIEHSGLTGQDSSSTPGVEYASGPETGGCNASSLPTLQWYPAEGAAWNN